MSDVDGADDEDFFDAFLAEAVGPFVFDLDGREYEVPVPSGEAVSALDLCVSDADVLYEFLDEDTADEVLDILDDEPVSALQDLVDDIRAHFGLLVPPRYGWAALVRDMNRYGAAAERDLAEIGVDMYRWVRDHEETPWDKWYRLAIDRRPEGGWVEAAQLEDEELALEHVKAEREGKVSAGSRRPPVKGWTRERENLERMTELLEQILHGVWGASPKFKGKGGAKPSAHPRPATAYMRVRRMAMLAEHDEIASQLLGSRYTKRPLPKLWDDESGPGE